ncbi:response regulator [Solilutibacter silvestris]|uniref:Response regulator receiver domain n=1 Tax=Solilutibacter silvestris TaxID=1645665 RepID=A0A2K1Q0J5_9GAMM|nr:Response regulator receiver domain [Lysobacter silvestris]
MSIPTRDLRHLVSEAPRVMVVDGSRMVRKLIGDVLLKELPNASVVPCNGVAGARAALAAGHVDLVTTSLVLPDGDGQDVARAVHEAAEQAYVPVIAVSSDVQHRLETRTLGDEITDYFDKELGYGALVAFLRGYVQPQPVVGARVLYIEDSRVAALAIKRMLATQGLAVIHVESAEAALDYLAQNREGDDAPGADLILTDVYLNGPLGGGDVLRCVRGEFRLGKRALPIIVMTGDENPDKQRDLLVAGANDLVLKPVEERLLVTKILFQLRAARLVRH